MQGDQSQGLGAGNTAEGSGQTRAKGAALPYEALLYTPLPQGLQRVPTAQPQNPLVKPLRYSHTLGAPRQCPPFPSVRSNVCPFPAPAARPLPPRRACGRAVWRKKWV